MAPEQDNYGAASAERWRPIPGFEGYYEASDQGRIRSLDRVVERTNNSPMRLKGKILSAQLRKNTGYYVVGLSRDSKPKDWYVHRLVLMAFVGMPQPGQEACHGNDVRTDNRLANLRWDSHAENVRDAVTRQRMRSHNREKTHCIRGHAFSEANTVIRPTGRGCRSCRRLTERIRYHKRKKAV